MQCHFSESEALSPIQIMEGFNTYAQYDVDLRISELDMSDENWAESDKATFFYQFLKTTFSHPAVKDFYVWGINDPLHWQDDAPFFDADWNPKPPLEKYKQLVFNQWWTDETGTTDDSGSYTTRAFKGEYEITVTDGDQETTKYVTVSDDTGTVEVDVSTSYEPPEEPDVDLMDAYRSSSDDDSRSRSSSDSTETPTETATPTPTVTPTEEPESTFTTTATETPVSTTTDDAGRAEDTPATEVTDESGPGMGVASAVAGLSGLVGLGRYLNGSTSEEDEN